MSKNTTNTRKAETTTPEYISVIQDLKQQAKKSLRFDYKTNRTKAPITESTTISNAKCTICNHQLNSAVGLKIHVTKMHKNINKTKNKQYTLSTEPLKYFIFLYYILYLLTYLCIYFLFFDDLYFLK
jgi:hypothetical protein